MSLEFEFLAVELEAVVQEVEVLLFLAFADLDFDAAGFELVVAEAAFFFLDGGVALADGGVFCFVDEQAEVFERAKVLLELFWFFGQEVLEVMGKLKGFLFEQEKCGG